MKNKSEAQVKIKKVSNSVQFILIPFATLLYGGTIASIAIAFDILVICVLRRNFTIFNELSLISITLILSGIIPNPKIANRRIIDMKKQIENITQKLIGLPLWNIGRAGSLIWFAFGVERRKIISRNGRSKIVSEYSLHVQCPWRIRRRNKIIVGYGDRSYPSGNDPYKKVSENRPDRIGDNQLDQRALNFINSHKQELLIVSHVKANVAGDVYITLNNVYSLDIFPSSSLTAEYWRLFKPASEEEHFVVTCDGIEID